MSRLGDIKAELTSVPRGIYPSDGFFVRNDVDDWLTGFVEASGNTTSDVFNAAIAWAFIQRAAHRHDGQLRLRGRQGEVEEPPALVEPFVRQENDVESRPRLTDENLQYLQRMQEWGMTPETAVLEGLRLLGAAALYPKMDIQITAAGEQGSLGLGAPTFLPKLLPLPPNLL